MREKKLLAKIFKKKEHFEYKWAVCSRAGDVQARGENINGEIVKTELIRNERIQKIAVWDSLAETR